MAFVFIILKSKGQPSVNELLKDHKTSIMPPCGRVLYLSRVYGNRSSFPIWYGNVAHGPVSPL